MTFLFVLLKIRRNLQLRFALIFGNVFLQSTCSSMMRSFRYIRFFVIVVHTECTRYTYTHNYQPGFPAFKITSEGGGHFPPNWRVDLIDSNSKKAIFFKVDLPGRVAKKFPPPSTAEEQEEEVREAAYTTLSKLALEEDILEKNTNLKQLNAKQWCVSISNPLSRPFPHLTAGIEQQETSTTLSALLKKENCFLNKFLHILREIALPCPPLPDRD